MRSEAAKYYSYAEECERQAKLAAAEDVRRKLTDLARVWMEAARVEETARRGERERQQAQR